MGFHTSPDEILDWLEAPSFFFFVGVALGLFVRICLGLGVFVVLGTGS